MIKAKEEKKPDYEKQANVLVNKIFNPKDWTKDLMNRMLPILAVSMAEAAVAHLLTLGIDVRKKKGKKKGFKHAAHNQQSHAGGAGGGFPDRPKSEIVVSKRGEREAARSTYEPVPGRKYVAYSDEMTEVATKDWMGEGSEEAVNAYEFVFADKTGSMEITGIGNAKAVIERSTQELMNHVEEMDMDIVTFTAEEPSRIKLYEFMSSRAERMMPGYVGFVHKENPKYFSIVKEKHAETVSKLGRRLKAKKRKGIVVFAKAAENDEDFWDDPDFWDDVEDGILNWEEKDEDKSFTKATTASEWAEDNQADWDNLVQSFSSSDVPIGILTDIPPWMQQAIGDRLTASFGEDYWQKVSETTMGNAETVLRQGLERGESIADMSKQLRSYFEDGGFRYARARSENIARTESGNALNGARKDSVKRLQDELGDKVPMKQSWLSVLGNTTRGTHADLDGVPEDARGMWDLGGYEVPWPAHTSLPPEERCNCHCSLTIEFGMTESEAKRLIGEYEERVVEGTEEEVAKETERVEEEVSSVNARDKARADALLAELQQIQDELREIREKEEKERKEGVVPSEAELKKRKKRRAQLAGEYEGAITEMDEIVQGGEDEDDDDKSQSKLREKHGDHDQSTHGRGGGGGVRGEGYSKKLEKKAIAWVDKQEEWKGKVNVQVTRVDIPELQPDSAIELSERTVEKYEKQVKEEIEEYGTIQRPFVAHRREDTGKLFLDDGNHYFQAVRNVYKEGGMDRESLRNIKVVEVSPKEGYKFETQWVSNYPQQVLVEDKKSQDKLREKHGDHDQSTHGRGGGGGEESKADRAKRTHKPSTAEKQRRGEAEQKRLAKLLGKAAYDKLDNMPFDVQSGDHAIEVKTVMDNNNDKITVHKSSRLRKEAAAEENNWKSHMVAIDVRGGRRTYYYRDKIGSFRLKNMQKVSVAQLKEIFSR